MNNSTGLSTLITHQSLALNGLSESEWKLKSCRFENLIGELHSVSDRSSKTKAHVPRHEVYAMDDKFSETESNTESIIEDDIAAIRSAGPNVKCWNCDELGHFWEDCLADRRIFCYGCGAPQVYKPQCRICQSRMAENRQKGATNKVRLPPKQ